MVLAMNRSANEMQIRIQKRIREERKNVVKRFMILVGTVLLLYGLVYFLFYHIPNPIRLKGHVHKTHIVHHGRYSTFCAAIQFKLNGQEHEVVETYSFFNAVKKGDSVILTVSQNDPTNFRIESKY